MLHFLHKYSIWMDLLVLLLKNILSFLVFKSHKNTPKTPLNWTGVFEDSSQYLYTSQISLRAEGSMIFPYAGIDQDWHTYIHITTISSYIYTRLHALILT